MVCLAIPCGKLSLKRKVVSSLKPGLALLEPEHTIFKSNWTLRLMLASEYLLTLIIYNFILNISLASFRIFYNGTFFVFHKEFCE